MIAPVYSDYLHIRFKPLTSVTALSWSGSCWSLSQEHLSPRKEYTLNGVPVHCRALCIYTFIPSFQSTWLVFGMWEEVVQPGRNPHGHSSNVWNSRQIVIQAQDQNRDHGSVRQKHYPLHLHAVFCILCKSMLYLGKKNIQRISLVQLFGTYLHSTLGDAKTSCWSV